MIQANHLLAGLPLRGHEEQVYHPDLEECLVEMFSWDRYHHPPRKEPHFHGIWICSSLWILPGTETLKVDCRQLPRKVRLLHQNETYSQQNREKVAEALERQDYLQPAQDWVLVAVLVLEEEQEDTAAQSQSGLGLLADKSRLRLCPIGGSQSKVVHQSVHPKERTRPKKQGRTCGRWIQSST